MKVRNITIAVICVIFVCTLAREIYRIEVALAQTNENVVTVAKALNALSLKGK